MKKILKLSALIAAGMMLFSTIGCSAGGGGGSSEVLPQTISVNMNIFNKGSTSNPQYIVPINREYNLAERITVLPENAADKSYVITAVNKDENDTNEYLTVNGTKISSTRESGDSKIILTVTAVKNPEATVSYEVKTKDYEIYVTDIKLNLSAVNRGTTESPDYIFSLNSETNLANLVVITPTTANNKQYTITLENTDVNDTNEYFEKTDANVLKAKNASGDKTATLKITSVRRPEVSSTYLIRTADIKVSSITVTDGQELSVPCEQEKTIAVTVSPADASNKTVTWESSDTTVATVDNNGKVTALKQGTTTITVKATDGSNITKTFDLTVTPYEYVIEEFETDKGFVITNVTLNTQTRNVSDWTGTGFLDNPEYIVYSVNSPSAQEVELVLRYAYWGNVGALRAAYPQVNGADCMNQDQIFYLNQKGKNLVYSNKVKVNLRQGENQIRLERVPAGTSLTKRTDAIEYGYVYPEGATPVDEGKAEGYFAIVDNLKIISEEKLSKGANSLTFSKVTAASENDSFGTVSISPVKALYLPTDEITITATPADGYVFDSWCGTTTKTTAAITISTNKDLNFKAHFIPASFDKTTELAGIAGYATVTDDSATPYTITGGFGGENITLTSLADITDTVKAKINGNDPCVITVKGTITTTGNLSKKLDIGSNKTFISDTTTQGRFKNIHLNILGSNVIVKNLMLGEVISGYKEGTVKGEGNDAMDLNGASHVWIDHCEFQSHLNPQNNDGTTLTWADAQEAGVTNNASDESHWKKDFYDGLLDIKNGSRFVTISNCYFHDHYKACLCGSSDVNENGDAAMRLTFVNNYWKNVNARQPLIRYGTAHIYNSYFMSESIEDCPEMYGTSTNVQSTAINCRATSTVYIEKNYFENIKTTIGYYNDESASQTGYWANVDNTFESCTNAPVASSTSYVPPYTYSAMTASEAKTYVLANAGVAK